MTIAADTARPAIIFENVRLGFEEGDVLKDISFTVAPREPAVLLGETGTGKTLTLKLAAGLIRPDAGRIEGGSVSLDEQDLIKLSEGEMRAVRGRDIAMIFQDPMSSLNPVLTVEEQMVETIQAHEKVTNADARRRAIELLGMVGIPKPETRLSSFPHQFSGGMRQRVMIAMALACDPTALLADEPTPALDAPIQAGIPDLMHHKYVVRDGSAVWTGSTNWTADSWTREENVILTIASPGVAGRYLADFEQLWTTRDVSHTGKADTAPLRVGHVPARAWFCPGRGEKLAHRIAKAIGTAQRRIRIASPVISSAPILATLAQVASDGKVDLAGAVDATQVHEVLQQWEESSHSEWKEPLLRTALTRAPFSGKRTTPYAPGSVHDYMHAKVTVADDVVFVGSFNLSHSGELNAENVLELEDAALADRLAAFVDDVRARYPAVAV